MSKIDDLLKNREKINPLDRTTLDLFILQKWNEILSYVNDKSTFYNNYPKHINTFDEIKNIKFTTSYDIKNNYEKLVLISERNISKIISLDTSGTTGESKRIFFTENDLNLTKDFFFYGLQETFHKNMNVLVSFSSDGNGHLERLIIDELKKIGCNAISIGINKKDDEIYYTLNHENIDGIVTSNYFLNKILNIFNKYNNKNYNKDIIKGILISSDSINKEDVLKYKNVFKNARIDVHYGMRESGLGLAVTCEYHNGMHIRENDIYVEIVNEKGEVLPDGNIGEIVITTFKREAMPLIRYKTNDFGFILSGKCECKSPLKRLSYIKRGKI